MDVITYSCSNPNLGLATLTCYAMNIGLQEINTNCGYSLVNMNLWHNLRMQEQLTNMTSQY